MKASLPTKPMYCSREYFKTSRLIQQYEKPTSSYPLWLSMFLLHPDVMQTKRDDTKLLSCWHIFQELLAMLFPFWAWLLV